MRFAAAILLSLVSLTVLPAADAMESVRLQLKWKHQFQFAGYYAAMEQGYYNEAGLDVTIKAASPGTDSVDVVLQGGAEYGVGNSGLLLSRNAGNPVVVLAVIMQHSPFVLITRQASTPTGIRDLKGKTLMIEPLADEIVAFLNHEGVPLKEFGQVLENPHHLNAFIAGEVDAIDAYSTDEPYQLMRRGVAFNIYHPRASGIDFYGDNLFTTESELLNHPQRVRRFREASLRGWRYAMSHQEEVIQLIRHKYRSEIGTDYLRYEAQQMQQLMLPELIDIGYMLEARWRHIAQTYASLGMLPENTSLDGLLYDPTPEEDYIWILTPLAITLSILVVVALVAMRFSKLNRQLVRLLHVQSQFANVGESVNNIAHQWKQPLNELGIQLMRIEQIIASSHLPGEQIETVQSITDKGHNILEFMADTADAFGHVLNTADRHTVFDPHTIIQEVLYLIRDSFAMRTISLEFHPGKGMQLKGNSTEFAHIILSILNNARDIFEERMITPARITLTTGSIEDDRFHLVISDNAGGIHARPLERIFTLGFSEKKGKDSGVGLFMAKKIVEEHFHGSLTARNITEGAEFHINLPRTT